MNFFFSAVTPPVATAPTGGNLGDNFAFITWVNGELVENVK